MATSRVRARGLPGQQSSIGLVPADMSLVDGWARPGESLELYTDDRAGEARLILVTEETEEHVATFFHAGGVVRATVWHGTGTERSESWQQTQRRTVASTVAARHARSEMAA